MKAIKYDLKKYPERKYPTIGICGLDCGLCPRYYTKGTSRCPGCCGPNFFNKHPSCSFITCCVKKKNLEVCAECLDFPCSKFKTVEEYQYMKESSSYPSNKNIIPNLNFIKKHGIKKFINQQKKRIRILENMIEHFDDGRSRSFFCRSVCLFDLKKLENSYTEASQKVKTGYIKSAAPKIKAKILREILSEFSVEKRVV